VDHILGLTGGLLERVRFSLLTLATSISLHPGHIGIDILATQTPSGGKEASLLQPVKLGSKKVGNC